MQKGFTLIELLIAVSIIGILIAIVVANIGTLRDNANDAALKQEASQLQRVAELYYLENNGTYQAGANGVCEYDLFVAVLDKHGIDTDRCNDSGTSWAIAAPLSNGNEWCVDVAGASWEINPDDFGENEGDECPAGI